MIGVLVGLILACIIIGVFVWAGQKLIALVPIAEPFKTIIYVLFVILMVLIVVWVIVTLLEAAGVRVPLMRMSLLNAYLPAVL